MISIKAVSNSGSSLQKLFENEQADEAMEYYRELSKEGYSVQYTSLPDMTVEQYITDLNNRVKKILDPNA